MEIYKKLETIQKHLKAPKSQFNSFGKYSYRNCDDILEAVKPLLDGCVILLSDEPVAIGSRYYIKAIAKFTDGKDCIEVNGFAREEESKKGMDSSQLTGSTSSYARKYALNGLLLIDDSKDADSMDNRQSVKTGSGSTGSQKMEAPNLTDLDMQWIDACKSDPLVINQIEDPQYKKFIQSKLK